MHHETEQVHAHPGDGQQRLAAVGEMAAGIAHEIRNPLASMAGSIQILRDELPLTPDQSQLMDIVLRESDRLNDTIRSFLSFARPQRMAVADLDVRQVLTDTARLIENSADVTDHHSVVVVVPSISLEHTTAGSGTLMQAMEERALLLLLLLRQPRLRMIYVTSMPVQESIVEYYLGLLSGVIPSHARARLTMVPIGDASPTPLSAKLLARPMAELRTAAARGERVDDLAGVLARLFAPPAASEPVGVPAGDVLAGVLAPRVDSRPRRAARQGAAC